MQKVHGRHISIACNATWRVARAGDIPESLTQAQQILAAGLKRDPRRALSPRPHAVIEVRELFRSGTQVSQQAPERRCALHAHIGAEHCAAVQIHGLHPVAMPRDEVYVDVARHALEHSDLARVENALPALGLD